MIFVKPNAFVPFMRLGGSTILASTKIEFVELVEEDQPILGDLRGRRGRGGHGYVQGAIAGEDEANNRLVHSRGVRFLALDYIN